MSAPSFTSLTGAVDLGTATVAILGVCAVAVAPRVVAYGASMVLAVIDWHNTEKDWHYIFTGARRDIASVGAVVPANEYGDDHVPESYLKNHEAWRDISRFIAAGDPNDLRNYGTGDFNHGKEEPGFDDMEEFNHGKEEPKRSLRESDVPY